MFRWIPRNDWQLVGEVKTPSPLAQMRARGQNSMEAKGLAALCLGSASRITVLYSPSRDQLKTESRGCFDDTALLPGDSLAVIEDVVRGRSAYDGIIDSGRYLAECSAFWFLSLFSIPVDIYVALPSGREERLSVS